MSTTLLEPQAEILDAHDQALIDTVTESSIDVSALAEVKGKVITFRIKTRKELERVLELAPRYQQRGLGVVIRTPNEELKQELLALQAQQLVGYTPRFVVNGAKPTVSESDHQGTIAIRPDRQNVVTLIPEVKKSGIQPGKSVEIKKVKAGGIDLDALEVQLMEGNATVRIVDIVTIPDATLKALCRLSKKYPKRLDLRIDPNSDVEFARVYWCAIQDTVAAEDRAAKPSSGVARGAQPSTAASRPVLREPRRPEPSALVAPKIAPPVMPAPVAAAAGPQKKKTILNALGGIGSKLMSLLG